MNDVYDMTRAWKQLTDHYKVEGEQAVQTALRQELHDWSAQSQELSRLEAALRQEQQDRSAQAQELSQLDAALRREQHDWSAQAQELSRLEAALRQEQSERSVQSQELSRLEAALQSAQSTAQVATANAEQRQSEYTLLKGIHEDLQREMKADKDRYLATIDRLRTELQTQTALVNSTPSPPYVTYTATDVSNLTEQLAYYKDKNNTLSLQLTQMEGDLTAVTQNRQHIRSELDSCKQQIATLTQQISTHTSHTELTNTYLNQIKALESELNHLKTLPPSIPTHTNTNTNTHNSDLESELKLKALHDEYTQKYIQLEQSYKDQNSDLKLTYENKLNQVNKAHNDTQDRVQREGIAIITKLEMQYKEAKLEVIQLK